MICKRMSTFSIHLENLISFLSAKQVSANSLSSKENQSSKIIAGLAAKSAEVVCSKSTIIKADLGSSRWIRLRNVSASKEKETYPATFSLAWPISQISSCFCSQKTKVPIVTLSLRTNGKNCLWIQLMILVHARWRQGLRVRSCKTRYLCTAKPWCSRLLARDALARD